jgi:hypothetical protein
LSIANLGVGTGQLALNAVTTAQILNGTILNEDIVDNTIIATEKLTSACTNNQILQANGAGNFVCANLPAAGGVTSVYGRTGVVVALDDDYTASQINNTATGNIIATDVQAAINELDTEKLALAGGTMTGAINMSSNLISNLATPVSGTDATTKLYVDTAVAGAAGAPGGATTQVQFNNAGAFAGDSNFVWDNVNKRLGLGTTSPEAKLHILDALPTGTVQSTGTTITGTGTNFTTVFEVGDKFVANREIRAITSIGSDTSLTVSSTYAANLDPGSYYGNVGAVLNSGHVGIGTVDPVYSLHIANSGGLAIDREDDGARISLASRSIINSRADNTDGPALIGMGKARGTISSPLPPVDNDLLGELSFRTYRNGEWQTAGLDTSARIRSRVSGAPVGDSVPANLTFYTTDVGETVSTERMKIDTDGSVGIGTTTPTEMLDVAGNVKGVNLCIGNDCRSAWPGTGGGGTVTSVATGTGLTGGPITGSGTVSIANLGVGSAQLANDSVTSGKILNGTILNADIAANTINATQKLTSACTNNQILQANGAGNFVCANLPAAPVTSVYGRTGVVVALDDDYTASQINNTAAGTIVATDVQAAINELDTEKLALAGGTMSGNILMGSTNRIRNLASPLVNADAATKLYVDTQVAGAAGAPGGTTTQVQFNNAGAFAGDSNFVWDNTNKRLGIGTNSPTGKLHIENDGVTEIRVRGFADDVNAGAPFYISEKSRGTKAAPLAILDNDILAAYEMGGFDGTDFSGARASLKARAEEDWTPAAQGTLLSFETTEPGQIVRSPKMRIKGDGKVGIGILNPASLLHLNTSENDQNLLALTCASGFCQQSTSTSGITTVMGATPSFPAGFIGTNTNHDFRIRTNATARFTVTNTGDVGIGTSTPVEKLEVVGNIRGTNLCIGADCRSAWPGSGGGGTVTSVTTGTGLTGGPITGSGTISIANQGVDTAQIAVDAVTTSRILNGTIQNADISANTINATQKLTSACTNNQILQVSGGSGNFVCANLPTPAAAPVDSVFGRTGVIVAAPGDYLASQITSVAVGDVSSTQVQGAINELANEKLSRAGGTMTGDISMSGTRRVRNLAAPAVDADAATKLYVDTAVAGAAGSPAGVTGQVQFNNAGSFGANNNFFWDSSNNRLGIGTAAPSEALTVNGRIEATSSIKAGAGSGGVAITNNDGYGNASVTWNHLAGTPEQDGNAARILVNTDATINAYMDFQVESGVTNGVATGLTNIMRLQADGNVGIGTTSPSSNLTVTRGTASAPIALFDDNSTAGDFSDVVVEAFRPGFVLRDSSGASSDYRLGVDGNRFSISIDTDDDQVKTASSNFDDITALAINDTGDVGIGTINPTEKLHVVGNVRGNQLCIGADCRSAWPVTSSGGTVTSIATGTGLTGGPITGSGTISIANQGVDTLQLANDSVTSAKIINGSILNADIAANTIDATTKLTSSCTTNQYLRASSAAGNFVCANLPSAPVTSVYGRTGVVVALGGDYIASQIDSTAVGNVGSTNVQGAINELANEKLNLTGGTMTGDISMSGTRRIRNLAAPAVNADAATKQYVDTQVAGASGSPAGANGQIQFNNAGSFGAEANLFWNASSNRLGIQNASPEDNLDIIGNTRFRFNTGANAIRMVANDGVGNMHTYYNSTGTISPTALETGSAYDFEYNAGASGNLTVRTAPSVAGGAAQNFTRTMTWSPDGNVGIGTDAPNERLHLNGANTNLKLERPNNGDFAAIRFATGGTNNWHVGQLGNRDTNGNFHIYNNDGTNNNGLTINKTTGNVGIGTLLPNYKLDVTEGAQFNSVVAGTDVYAADGVTKLVDYAFHYETIGSADGGVNLRLQSGGAVMIHSNMSNLEPNDNSKVRLIVNTAGNVGIGTVSPNAQLTVNGSANKPGGGAWAVFSDIRLKDQSSFKDFKYGLNEAMKLKPIYYNYAEDNELDLDYDKTYVGFVAQEVQNIIPDAVEENLSGYLEINNDPIIWTILNAVKELAVKVTDGLTSLLLKVSELTSRVDLQQERFYKLEQKFKDFEKRSEKILIQNEKLLKENNKLKTALKKAEIKVSAF